MTQFFKSGVSSATFKDTVAVQKPEHVETLLPGISALVPAAELLPVFAGHRPNRVTLVSRPGVTAADFFTKTAFTAEQLAALPVLTRHQPPTKEEILKLLGEIKASYHDPTKRKRQSTGVADSASLTDDGADPRLLTAADGPRLAASGQGFAVPHSTTPTIGRSLLSIPSSGSSSASSNPVPLPVIQFCPLARTAVVKLGLPPARWCSGPVYRSSLVLDAVSQLPDAVCIVSELPPGLTPATFNKAGVEVIFEEATSPKMVHSLILRYTLHFAHLQPRQNSVELARELPDGETASVIYEVQHRVKADAYLDAANETASFRITLEKLHNTLTLEYKIYNPSQSHKTMRLTVSP